MTPGKKRLLEKIKRAALKKLGSSKGSHDAEHTLRVASLAGHIAQKEGADMFAVLAAAYLHDIARLAEDESGGKIDHALKGATDAVGILKGFKVADQERELIAGAIRTHRFRGNCAPESKEAKCLFDADKLDSIGAVGIGRAFLFAGETGAKLHNPGKGILKTKPYTKEDTAYREFMVKLRHVKGRMQTAEGKKMAARRHAFMITFFRELDSEISGAV